MNQAEIGKFIARCRREKKLTQAQIAEKLNITDRAVSKWESGKSMPDSSIMLELCEILGITANELLSGEKIDVENLEKKADEKKCINMYSFLLNDFDWDNSVPHLRYCNIRQADMVSDSGQFNDLCMVNIVPRSFSRKEGN